MQSWRDLEDEATPVRPWVVWAGLWAAGALLLSGVFAVAWLVVPYAVTSGGLGFLALLVAAGAVGWSLTAVRGPR